MWMVCCWQLIASNIPALNTRVQMERIASNIAGNIARCGCPFRASTSSTEVSEYVLRLKGASTPSNIASNIAGNTFHLNSGVQGGDIAGN